MAVPLDRRKKHAGANRHAIKANNPGEAVIEGEIIKSEL